MKDNKGTAVDQVVEMLTDRIHRGHYPPGSRLPSERRLQEQLGVGRLALREALNRLSGLGITETAHGRGTFVQSELQSTTLRNILIPHCALDSSKRVQELMDARIMIESELAALAARQRTTGDIRRLERILDQEVTAATPPELVAYLDLQFHQELALIADNQFLRLMHEALLAHIRTFLDAYVHKADDRAAILAAHQPVLEAIRHGDAEDARSRMRLHISFSKMDYQRFADSTSGQ